MKALDMLASSDPCDGWPWAWPRTGYRWQADRSAPVCLEGFAPEDVTIERAVLAPFLPYVRTDWAHWPSSLDWTLESGPADAPSCVDIVVPYRYYAGSGPSWDYPGDPPELESGVAYTTDERGKRLGELVLLQEETELVERHIDENPDEPDYPEPDYRDD